MRLLHGTTRTRAEQILQHGPNPRFQEPGGQPTEEGFSMYLEAGPFQFGTPQDYARGKANAFPEEGGSVILIVDVPDEIIAKAITDWLPLGQGLVQFNTGAGVEELLVAWPALEKRIEDVP